MNIYVGLGGYAIRCLAYLFKENYINDELFFIDSDEDSNIFSAKLDKAHVVISKNLELVFDEYQDLKNKLDNIVHSKKNNICENSTININILTTMCGNFGSSNIFGIGSLFRDYFEKSRISYRINFLIIPKLNIGSPDMMLKVFNKRIDKFITMYQDSSFSELRRNDTAKLFVPEIKDILFCHIENDFMIEIYNVFELLSKPCPFSYLAEKSNSVFELGTTAYYINSIYPIDRWIKEVVKKFNKNHIKNIDEYNDSDIGKVKYPYKGDSAYIFVSYAHKDKKEVYPIIEKLMNDGFRVWYDDGIDPGTEWDENIAKHIEDCGYFIPFISENYLKSSNCKDELNFARDLDKDRFLVYLENVNLPSGMNMRLSRLQNIHKYSYGSFDEFYNKLLTAKGINDFK